MRFRNRPKLRGDMLRLAVRYPVRSYTATMQVRKDGEVYEITIIHSQGNATITVYDAAIFGAYVALLSTGNAEYEPDLQQLRAKG